MGKPFNIISMLFNRHTSVLNKSGVLADKISWDFNHAILFGLGYHSWVSDIGIEMA